MLTKLLCLQGFSFSFGSLLFEHFLNRQVGVDNFPLSFDAESMFVKLLYIICRLTYSDNQIKVKIHVLLDDIC